MTEPPRDPYERYRPRPSREQPTQGPYGQPANGQYDPYEPQPSNEQAGRPRFIPSGLRPGEPDYGQPDYRQPDYGQPGRFIPRGDYYPPPQQTEPRGGWSGQPPQTPPPPPPKKKHTLRKILIGGGAFVVLVIILVSVTTKRPQSSPVSSVSSPAVSASASASAKSTASPSPAAKTAAPFEAQTLLATSGSGQYQTVRYTVGGTGDYDIDWTYSEGSMGTSVNFQIFGDGGSDFAVTDPNQLGTGGSGVVHVYNDAGTHYLQVNSEGDWTLKVVTTP